MADRQRSVVLTRVVRLLGQTPYALAHRFQESVVQWRVEDRVEDTLIVVEHPPTITVGRRRGAEKNVIRALDVDTVWVERGGDVTYHAPGQLVVYPVVGLRGARRDVHLHLSSLEAAVIDLLSELGVSASRDPRNTGVWVAGRKICSMGIAVRRWTTWHGLALNVSVDMAGFERIRPCGFASAMMTRLADQLSPCPSVDDLVAPLCSFLAERLDLEPPNRHDDLLLSPGSDLAAAWEAMDAG